MKESRHHDDEQPTPLAPIDLLLGQGSEEDLRAMRRLVGEDPTVALDLADTVALVEQLRGLRTEASPALPGRLNSLVRRAERRLTQPTPRVGWMISAAAAALIGGFLGAGALDAFAFRGAEADRQLGIRVVVEAEAPAAADVREPIPTSAELAHRDSVAAMRNRFVVEDAGQLVVALDEAEHCERDPLASWLNPRNLLALRRLDHELRKLPEVRRRALRSSGAMVAADARVQEMADRIAEGIRPIDLPDGGARLGIQEVSLAVRALVAAGITPGPRERAFEHARDWLLGMLPELHGAARVYALAGLVECAAVDDTAMPEIAEAGEILLASVLTVDDEVWSRRRPDLLREHTRNEVLGEAGRMLGMLPAMGVDVDRCQFVRRLLLGELEQRRSGVEYGPDLLAAMLYGFGDMVPERSRNWLVLQLGRWKPERLAPDYVTIRQIAWGTEPGQSGYTRLQLQLRKLTVLPEPERFADRSAMCMTLASTYAAPRTSSLERYVGE